MSDELFNKNDINNDNQENTNTINNENSNQDTVSIPNMSESHIEQNNTNVQYNNNSTYSFWAEQIASSTPNQKEDKPIWINEMNNKTNNQNYVNNQSFQNDTNNQYIQNNQGIQNVPNNQHNYDYSQHSFDLSGGGSNNKPKKRPKFIWKATKFVLGAAVFGLIAGGTFLGVNALYYEVNPDATPFVINFRNDSSSLGGYKLNISQPEDAQKISATTVSKDMITGATDITDVVEATMPSIVTITSTYTQSYNWFGQQYDQENEGGGSGFIVGKNDTELLIATNNHVVEGADPITVTFIDDTKAEAIIKGTDAIADLAVISIDLSSISEETMAAIDIAKLGDSESVKVGQMAIAIGNALGYGQSTTVGYISAKDREVAVSDKTMVLLQTDAAINPGNSGGALLNIKGEVIGINTVKYASSEVEGMGFAIPISRALPIINELMSREILKDEEKGYIGVYPNDVTEDIATMYNWPIGVYVTELVEDGAASKAGVLVGDIITKVNDTEITASTQLRDKVTSYRAGTEITLTIMRNANGKFEEKQIIVTLEKNPQLIEN